MFRTLIDVIVAAIVIYGAGNLAYNGIYLALKKETVRKVSRGLRPLEPFTQKMTGEKLPF